MVQSEGGLLKKFMVEYSKIGSRLFRNNVGRAWTGNIYRSSKIETVKLNPGDVLIRNARVFHGGFPKGSSDLIGFTKVEITPEMVGRTVAVFTAAEVKYGKTSTTPEQTAFVRMVNDSGGIAAITRKLDDFLGVVRGFKNGETTNKH